MIRVLIVSSAYPPHESGGVRRVAAFAGHLRALGFEVDTLAGEGEPTFRYQPIAEPLRRAAARVKLGRAWRAATRTLLPDAKVLDLPPLLSESIPCPDVIVASAPPASILVAGVLLARRFDRPLIADLRDPWSDHPHLAARALLPRLAQRELERRTLSRASVVLTATNAMKRSLEARMDLRVETICNGYDPELFAAREREGSEAVAFYGSIYDPIDPEPLVRAVAAADRTLEFAGQDYDRKLEHAAERHGARLDRLGHLEGKEVARRMMRAAVLALILPADPAWYYVRTQKLAEYLASGRPILAMVPEGEAAEVIRSHDAGTVVPADDWRGAAEAIASLAARPSRAQLPVELAWGAQVERLGEIIRSLV